MSLLITSALFLTGTVKFVTGFTSGPVVQSYYPSKITFSNDTGYVLSCIARGKPTPVIEWLSADDRLTETISGIRIVYQNGSLYFPPFAAHTYRPEVHSRGYRCRARNNFGQSISNLIQINAVIKQDYEIQVYDVSALTGNVALLKCVAPVDVAEFIDITSWMCGTRSIYADNSPGDKYVFGPNRELYIYDINPSDSFVSFFCRTSNSITHQFHTNTYPARVAITEPEGNMAPKLLVERQTRLQVNVRTEVKMSCIAQGYPVPSYKFYRDNKGNLTSVQVAPHSRIEMWAPGMLKLKDARLDDSGQYVCIVNNSLAEERVLISLTVVEPLVISIEPVSHIINIGKPLELKCMIIEGYPITKISWYHNGQLIAAGGKRIRISDNEEKLIITEANKDDNGMYQCFAENKWGCKHDTAQLLLGDVGPEIVERFSEQTLQPGPPLTLKCVAKGTPYPTIVWKLDGFLLPDSSRFMVAQYVSGQDEVISHVNISSLKDEDGGEYSCSAKNKVGEITYSARINVYGLPYIRTMPKITAIAGKKLIIKCPVAGYPIETITWEQGGVLLPVNRRQRVYTNGTLVVEQVKRNSDAGSYTCQAQNRQKHSARRDVEVQVLVPPKIMPIPPMTNLLQEGMRAGITCQVVEGDLPISFQWIKTNTNGETLELNAVSRRIDEYTSSLIIDVLRSSHAGNYTCIARNSAGEERFTIPLTVNVQPKWLVEPKDVSVSAGKSITLNCQAEGYPIPTIIWKKAINDNPGEYKDFLYEPNLNFFRNGSLQFLHVEKNNEGYYMCEAKNEIGTGISKVVYLKVNSPVHFVQKSKQLNIMKGDQAHLQCNALGDNPIEVTWKGSKGQTISADTDARYVIREQMLDEGLLSELGITKVFRHDTGIFTCHARNGFGHDEMTVELIVQEVPEAPKNIRIIEQGSRSVTVAWNQPYSGNSPIVNYIIQHKLASAVWTPQSSKITVPSIKSNAVLDNLMPSTAYHIRILAENNVGYSEPSDVIQVTTQEEAPSGPPRDVKVKAESSTELAVTWEAPSKDLWNGNLLGYIVGYKELNDDSDPPTMISSNKTISSLLSSNQQYVLKTVEVDVEYSGKTTLTGLNMYTTYSVVVQAFNSRGTGPFSDSVSTRTEEGVPTMPAENVRCTAITSQSVQVLWDPPPVDGRNGLIQGYRVWYQPAEDWYEKNDYVTKTTASQLTVIMGLLKYTNYSFIVVAYTKCGDGVKSSPIHCRTEEDVPSSPAGIKAFLSSLKKIVISWLPPANPNGKLTGYTFYMAVRNGPKENGTLKRTLSDSILSHETPRLYESATYQFWITASTKIGEGESTRVASVPPSATVSARILSFSQEILTPWKKNISLPCLRVGQPLPKLVWTLKGKVLTTTERIEVSKDGVLLIADIQRSDVGNYSCTVENSHGKDQITYAIFVRVPPEPPELTIINEETDSLHLVWRDTEQPDIPILGYVINYKRDHGDWEEIHIDSKSESYELRNLWCGTKYQLYMAAYNKIGTGLPCDIVTAYTKGSVPIPPVGTQQAMTYNTTAASVWLDMWNDGGCSILYFMVEHKKECRADWMLSPKTIDPAERTYVITQLEPSTRYQVKITAHNNIGSAVQTYNFTTLSEEGGTVIPLEFATSGTEIEVVEILFSSLSSIISVSVLVIILSGVFTTICYIKKKRFQDLHDVDETTSVTDSEKRSREKYSVKGSRSQQTLSTEPPMSCKTDSTEYMDDICPYATFQLSGKPSSYGESTFSGNVYSGPYHAVGSSFIYHDLKQPGGTGPTLPKHHPKDHPYTKVKTRPIKGRDQFSESQESDNLGSTDSEVKKILSLHMPISEYDTLGSDSEADGGVRRSAMNNQELVLFKHHTPAREESSSSSEMSPTDGRKSVPPLRKTKWRGQVIGKSKDGTPNKNINYAPRHDHDSSFSNYSNNVPINPPSRFSDTRPAAHLSRRSNDVNCSNVRHSSHGNNSSPASGTSSNNRFTQDSTFQIDV